MWVIKQLLALTSVTGLISMGLPDAYDSRDQLRIVRRSPSQTSRNSPRRAQSLTSQRSFDSGEEIPNLGSFWQCRDTMFESSIKRVDDIKVVHDCQFWRLRKLRALEEALQAKTAKEALKMRKLVTELEAYNAVKLNERRKLVDEKAKKVIKIAAAEAEIQKHVNRIADKERKANGKMDALELEAMSDLAGTRTRLLDERMIALREKKNLGLAVIEAKIKVVDNDIKVRKAEIEREKTENEMQMAKYTKSNLADQAKERSKIELLKQRYAQLEQSKRAVP